MGTTITKIDYNYGQIIIKDKECVKIMSYDFIAREMFMQQLKQTPILNSIEEINKLQLCSSQGEIKATLQYFQITLEKFVYDSIATIKETQVLQIIKDVLNNINQNKIQIHPKEILMPNCYMLDPEFFLLKSDIQRIRQGIIKIQDYYIAPEIFKGKCKSNSQSQIFSLGLICVFIMTKCTPYDYDIYDEKSQIKEQNLQKYVNKINLGIYSQLLIQLILDMLQIDPKKRINEELIQQKIIEINEFHQSKNLKLQDIRHHKTADNLSKISDQGGLEQSQLSYKYNERPSENLMKLEKKQIINTYCNSPIKNNQQQQQDKENIQVEFITQKKRKSYNYSACSSRVKGSSVYKQKQQNEKYLSPKRKWK